MKGQIYSEQRCFACGGALVHDENRDGLFCKEHPQVCATAKFIVRFGRKTTKRFNSYIEARQFLNGLRFKTVEGTFDARDYHRGHPLGFRAQVTKWLSIKKRSVSANHYRDIKRDMDKAIKIWGDRNVKTIKYADIEDWLYGMDVSDKTRHNARSALHSFYTWLCDRDETVKKPRFPKIEFELGWRNIIDLSTQKLILDEIYHLTWDYNPRIWIGIKWLATYIAIRPDELRNLRERDINVTGYFVIPSPKEKDPKLVPMLDDDIDLYQSITPRGLPDMPFFRHIKGNGAAKPGSKFGKDYLYKWWKKACINIGVNGVDLYGGTRHSTATSMSRFFSESEIMKAGTMHKSNKAARRYIQANRDNSIQIYQKIRKMQDGEIIPLKVKKK